MKQITMPKNAQEGLINFVQMIINEIEAGNTAEALLKAIDLREDLATGMYKVETAPQIDLTTLLPDFNND